MLNSLDFDLDDEGIKFSTLPNFNTFPNVSHTIKNDSKNKQQSISNKSTSKFLQIKRKFPGPAGVLPTRNSEEEIKANLILSEINTGAKNTEILLEKGLICSQASNKFIGNVWDTVSNDYGKLMEMYNVKCIQTYWNDNKLINQKVPFLAAMIKSLERANQSKNSIINVTLEDESGELQGTVHHSLFEKFGVNIKVGTILVLKNCSVLPSNVGDHPHLLITTRNLIRIYRKDSDSILLQNLNVDEFLNEIVQYKNGNKRIKLDTFKVEDSNKFVNVNKSELSNSITNQNQIYHNKSSNNTFPVQKLNICNKQKDTNQNEASKSKFQFKKQNQVLNIFQDNNFDLDLNCDFNSDIEQKIVENLSQLETNLKTQLNTFPIESSNNESKYNETRTDNHENKSFSTSDIVKNGSKNPEIEKKLENKITDSNSDIWKSAFEGVDIDDFLSDF